MTTRRFRVFTVGHSNHSAEDFVALLARHGIAGIADVRSQPYSRYARHFGRETVQAVLQRAGVEYRFFGEELGGRPKGEDLYDENGRLVMGLAAARPEFADGLQRLRDWAGRIPVALMCGEGDPSRCHRRHLVGRELEATGEVEVVHVLRDGATISESDLGRMEVPPQMELFGD